MVVEVIAANQTRLKQIGFRTFLHGSQSEFYTLPG
jgi:hypothetical protein